MNVKILKAQSLLQEALQEALFALDDARLKSLAITKVECSRGKELARVFLDANSLGDFSAEAALKALKNASGAIRANLQASLSWYKTPQLRFFIDESLENINRLEDIFKKIHAESGDSRGDSRVESGELRGDSSDSSVESRDSSADSIATCGESK